MGRVDEGERHTTELQKEAKDLKKQIHTVRNDLNHQVELLKGQTLKYHSIYCIK